MIAATACVNPALGSSAPIAGPSSSLDSQTPIGPIYRNPKRNPKAPAEPQSKRLKANRDITAAEVRLVGDDGQHQVMSLTAALKAAQDAKLDLVQVAGEHLPLLPLTPTAALSFATLKHCPFLASTEMDVPD